MTEFEMAVMEELREIKAAASSTAATVRGMHERLFNGGSGVIFMMQKEIDGIKDDRRWKDRFKTAVGPVAVLLHIIAHKLGWKI